MLFYSIKMGAFRQGLFPRNNVNKLMSVAHERNFFVCGKDFMYQGLIRKESNRGLCAFSSLLVGHIGTHFG